MTEKPKTLLDVDLMATTPDELREACRNDETEWIEQATHDTCLPDWVLDILYDELNRR